MTGEETAGAQAERIALRARVAAERIGQAGTKQKNRVLREMQASLARRAADVAAANEADLEAARRSGLSGALLERLRFGRAKLKARVASLGKIADLPDPVGRILRDDQLPGGLRAVRVAVPLGVVLMIYEARPHVSVNAGAFCLKAGNACILRGGSEARRCNALLGELWGDALEAAGLPREGIQMVSGSHEDVRSLLKRDGEIDLVIPRGGQALIRAVSRQSRIPVVKHDAGVCHVYVDGAADAAMAERIVVDSKCLMPEVCNAMETLLVSAVDPNVLRSIVLQLQRCGVRVKGCGRTRAACPGVERAGRKDWTTEYLDMAVSVRVVGDVDSAIEHINTHGSHHTDSIVTNDARSADAFCRGVDSAVVLVNASTMFCDGESLGMGAEIGISTGKLHARGPMGLEELTGYKFIIRGGGNVMGDPEEFLKT